MQFDELGVVPLLLSDLIRAIFDLSLLEGALGTDLIQLSLAVLSALLELSEALGLFLLFFLQAFCLSNFGLFSLLLLLLVLGDLLVQALLGLACGILLFKSRFIGGFDLVLHDFDAMLLGSKSLSVLALHLQDVGLKLSLFLLAHLLILHALFLSRGDLVDKDLSAALLSLNSTLLALKLSLDGLQALDLHHHIESLLLIDPVLFKN
jgi:hypothetical protein|mmetsp:Transcript_41514/g.54646  ORF Transcript_41514/g.54646 Transcript_41514/m.54646 type:complete len:207 (-) Transcript_41514:572-1192(-)